MECTTVKDIDGIKFGMTRETVRKVLPGEVREFKKTKFSKTTTDDFEFFQAQLQLQNQ